MIAPIQISQIDNGWIVAGGGDGQTTRPIAVHCEDTFEVYKILRGLLPTEKPRIIKNIEEK